jgi:hypothetical protein
MIKEIKDDYDEVLSKAGNIRILWEKGHSIDEIAKFFL